MIEKKIAIIGIGNCGNQIANLAEKKYGDLFDAVYINSSESDLSMVGDSKLKFKIGSGDMEGSGKNREITKKYLKEDISDILANKDFQDVINSKKYVFVISSAAGGTGSGAAPVMLNILKEVFVDVHFILVSVLPQLQASWMEQGNARQYCDELYRNLSDNTTYMIYDNETTSDLSSTQSLVAVNEAVVEDIRILSGVDNYPTPYESIDEADMESIITTPGRLVVTRVKKGLTEKILEDTVIDDIIIKSIKNSCHAETNRDKRVVRWGIITYFTEEVNKLYGSNLEKLHEFIGTPVERFNHNAVNENNENMNFLYLIMSGLSPINDRIAKIDKRVEELKLAEEEAKRRAGQYEASTENGNYDVMAERAHKANAENKVNNGVNIANIFDKF